MLGLTVGSYRVAQLIGRGGMGRVYLGVQPQIGAKVAIKVLLAGDGDGRRVERFFAEARAVNLVRHEHIVDVLDLGTLADGAPYMVMELVEGATLATLVSNRSLLPIGSVSRLVVEVLEALEATHEKGIFHRDLKPDNVSGGESARHTHNQCALVGVVLARDLSITTHPCAEPPGTDSNPVPAFAP